MRSTAEAPTTPPSAATHRAARDDHLDARPLVEQHGDVDVVGDDEQVLVSRERLGDLLGRRADVDEQRAAVRDDCGRGNADRPLFGRGDETPRLVGDVLDAGGDDRAAVNARQKMMVAEIVEVLADRLHRDVVTPGEVLDADLAGCPGEGHDLVLSDRKNAAHWEAQKESFKSRRVYQIPRCNRRRHKTSASGRLRVPRLPGRPRQLPPGV